MKKDKLTTKMSKKFSLKGYLDGLPKLKYEGIVLTKEQFRIIKKLAMFNGFKKLTK